MVFDRHIEDWSLDNWTSKLRADHDLPPFTQPEKEFTDFTYADIAGRMRAFLQTAGVHVNDEWSEYTTYHLEVKATCENRHDEPFYLSQNQVDTVSLPGGFVIAKTGVVDSSMQMRKYDKDPNNAYILLRVYGIHGSSPGFKIYSCPWSLYMNGGLTLLSRGGYQGQTLNASEFSAG